MPVTSLPSPWGIGTLGAAAREFVDFLAASGQTLWQILPIGPTGFGDSPYQVFSTYAGNPYLIDLDELAAEGLLERSEYEGVPWGDDPLSVDYGALFRGRYAVLERACARLRESRAAELASFCARESAWLEDYALFMAIKDAQGGAPWVSWPDGLRRREAGALDDARRLLSDRVDFWKALQCLFFRQWDRLREYAAGAGVLLMGDIPIYVAPDSADVWASPEQFQLDESLLPVEVAGCPPDGFAVGGQLWGNPLYDWELMERDGFSWWVERVTYQLRLYDILRIDHFRGFDSYYSIPFGAPDAREGRWREGPGTALFERLRETCGTERLVAEDLGYLTGCARPAGPSASSPRTWATSRTPSRACARRRACRGCGSSSSPSTASTGRGASTCRTPTRATAWRTWARTTTTRRSGGSLRQAPTTRRGRVTISGSTSARARAGA